MDKFDSEEERLFYLYCVELKENGFIDSFDYQPEPFLLSSDVVYSWKKELKTKTKNMESNLLRNHIYTIDFKIYWNESARGIFFNEIEDEVLLSKIPFVAQDKISHVEVKGSFDFNNMTRLATVNIKWVYDKWGIYINKIIPNGKKTCLFAKTFVPKEAMLTVKTKKPKKYKFTVNSLESYLERKDKP